MKVITVQHLEAGFCHPFIIYFDKSCQSSIEISTFFKPLLAIRQLNSPFIKNCNVQKLLMCIVLFDSHYHFEK